MINKKNIAVSAMMLGLASDNTNACTCCAVPEELKILEYILKDAKQLAGLTDKSKLVDFLKEKNNYRDKVKGKDLKRLTIRQGSSLSTFQVSFYVYLKDNNGKQQVIAAKELPSGVTSRLVLVVLTFNGGTSSNPIKAESNLNDDTEYTINSVTTVNDSYWG